MNKENPNTKRQFLINSKILTITQRKINEEDEKSEVIPNSYKVTVKVNKREDLNSEVKRIL